MSKIKYLISSLILFVLSASAVFADEQHPPLVPVVSPPPPDAYGLYETAKGTGIATGGTIAAKIGTITGYVLSLVGILFFGLMVYGGFLWMTAKGDEAQAKKAQGIIVDAVIGLVIVAAAYIITSFVFKAVE